MIKTRSINKNAQATSEFMAIIALFIAVVILFSYYLVGGIAGRWKQSGDIIGSGKVYDGSGKVTGTIECVFDQVHTQSWYSSTCYDEKECARKCFGVNGSDSECVSCIMSCQTEKCTN